MNQKKCPKCGELNPPEAVMCWACYTPLTGGAVAGAAAGGVAATTATARSQAPARPDTRSNDDDQKTGIAPWQIGAVVVALLLAGGGAFMMMGGKPAEDTTLGDKLPITPPGGTKTSLVMPNPGKGGISSLPGVTLGTVTMPPQASNRAVYRVTTPPARDTNWPSIGIVPSASVSTAQAAALAKAAFQQLGRGRSWQGAYVFVFSDTDAASAFQSFQKARQGAPLGNGDYASLSEIWPKTLVRYEYNNGNEDTRFPSSAPGDWWTSASNYTKAR